MHGTGNDLPVDTQEACRLSYVLWAYCVVERREETEIRRLGDRQEETRTEENDRGHQLNVKEKRKKYAKEEYLEERDKKEKQRLQRE